jgi:hypothetical protein
MYTTIAADSISDFERTSRDQRALRVQFYLFAFYLTQP